jgi:GTP-binding protein EngB required for normal cell division
MLESKLYPVVQKHHDRLQKLKHVYNDAKLCFSDVEQKLKSLSNSGENMRSLLSKEDKTFIESAVTYKRRPVSIFMGQRNCGKSSLVNEILRKSCLPTHENPCTARMVRLTYGAQSIAYLIDKDGPPSKEVPCKKQRVPSEFVNLSEERRRDIAEVRKLVLAEIDLPILQCGVDFIDSPGFGENVILDQMIEEFIHDDIEPVIVYVINGKEMLRTQVRKLERKCLASIEHNCNHPV